MDGLRPNTLLLKSEIGIYLVHDFNTGLTQDLTPRPTRFRIDRRDLTAAVRNSSRHPGQVHPLQLLELQADIRRRRKELCKPKEKS